MNAILYLSRVTTRLCELGLLEGFLWFEIQVATRLTYIEVSEYLGLSGCDSRPLGESSIFVFHGDKVHSVKSMAYVAPKIELPIISRFGRTLNKSHSALDGNTKHLGNSERSGRKSTQSTLGIMSMTVKRCATFKRGHELKCLPAIHHYSCTNPPKNPQFNWLCGVKDAPSELLCVYGLGFKDGIGLSDAIIE